MNPRQKFNPKRLREARTIRGLTINQLAEQIGVSKQAISQFELGDAVPKAEKMMAIVNTLKFPKNYFFEDYSEQHIGNTFFRARSAATKRTRDIQLIKAQWVAHIQLYLEQYIDFPMLNLPDLEKFENVEWNDCSIGSLANHVRNHWNLGGKPITNIPALLERNGILVAAVEVGNETVDAFCQPRQGQKPLVILSSDKQSASRRHFDGAHELGHLLMHKDDVDNQSILLNEEFKRIESQADRFASAFLLPEEPFRQTVKSTTLEYFIELKKYWRVSISAMIRRCKDLDIISEQRYTSLHKQMSMKRYKKKEPLDDVLAIPEPTVLKKAIMLLLENNIKNELQIVQEIGLPASFIESLCNLEPETLNLAEPEPVVSLKFSETSEYGFV